jgi:hypothetical protein
LIDFVQPIDKVKPSNDKIATFASYKKNAEGKRMKVIHFLFPVNVTHSLIQRLCFNVSISIPHSRSLIANAHINIDQLNNELII